MRFLSVNSDSFLIELSSLEETLALYSKLQNLHLNGIKDRMCLPLYRVWHLTEILTGSDMAKGFMTDILKHIVTYTALAYVTIVSFMTACRRKTGT